MLLTAKPVLYICNVDENSVINGNEHTKRFKELVKDEGAQVILISAAIEEEIAQLEEYEEKMMFVEEMGLTEPGANRVIVSCYKLLDLGSKAPQAAGVIHTDFEKGFIRAEVIAYNDFIEYGSEASVKNAGKLSIEGKEYVVKDGDVMHFLFNV